MSATNRSNARQPQDFYRTQSWVVEAILPHLPRGGTVLEPGCGDGAILRALIAAGFSPEQLVGIEIDEARAHHAATDTGVDVRCENYLTSKIDSIDMVITNPSFNISMEYAEKSIELVAARMGTVALLLRLDWLGTNGRANFHRKHPCDVYILPRRPEFVASMKCKEKCGYEEILAIDAPRPSKCPKCGEAVTCSTTDASEYAWFCWSPGRGNRWFILDVPAQKAKADALCAVCGQPAKKCRTLSLPGCGPVVEARENGQDAWTEATQTSEWAEATEAAEEVEETVAPAPEAPVAFPRTSDLVDSFPTGRASAAPVKTILCPLCKERHTTMGMCATCALKHTHLLTCPIHERIHLKATGCPACPGYRAAPTPTTPKAELLIAQVNAINSPPLQQLTRAMYEITPGRQVDAYCAICRTPQFYTPAGLVCGQAHNAGSVPAWDTSKWGLIGPPVTDEDQKIVKAKKQFLAEMPEVEVVVTGPQHAGEIAVAPKRRGRPPGSKNKPKDGAAPARTRKRASSAAKPATTEDEWESAITASHE